MGPTSVSGNSGSPEELRTPIRERDAFWLVDQRSADVALNGVVVPEGETDVEPHMLTLLEENQLRLDVLDVTMGIVPDHVEVLPEEDISVYSEDLQALLLKAAREKALADTLSNAQTKLKAHEAALEVKAKETKLEESVEQSSQITSTEDRSTDIGLLLKQFDRDVLRTLARTAAHNAVKTVVEEPVNPEVSLPKGLPELMPGPTTPEVLEDVEVAQEVQEDLDPEVEEERISEGDLYSGFFRVLDELEARDRSQEVDSSDEDEPVLVVDESDRYDQFVSILDAKAGLPIARAVPEVKETTATDQTVAVSDKIVGVLERDDRFDLFEAVFGNEALANKVTPAASSTERPTKVTTPSVSKATTKAAPAVKRPVAPTTTPTKTKKDESRLSQAQPEALAQLVSEIRNQQEEAATADSQMSSNPQKALNTAKKVIRRIRDTLNL